MPRRRRRGRRRPRARGSRSVEDKASDILAMARSLVVDTASKRGGGRSRPPAGATTSKKRRPASAKRDRAGGDPLAAPVASAAQAMSQLRQHQWSSVTMQRLVAQQGLGAAEPPAAWEEADDDVEPPAPAASKFERSAKARRAASPRRRAPRSPRTPEAVAPPFFDHDANLAPLRQDYDARFSGLHAYGASGMTRLEEMVEAAMQASERAHAAAKAEARARRRSPGGSRAPHVQSTRCAALLARSGALHVTCAVASTTDASLSVSAERAAVLRAVADGDSAFLGLVVADAASDELPVPDGTARQLVDAFLPPATAPRATRALHFDTERSARPSAFERSSRRPSRRPPPSSSSGSRSRSRSASDSRSGSRSSASPEAAPPVARAEAAAWSVDDVVAFVEATLRKDAYSATFRKAKVNGALLLRLDARDLEETLGVAHGLDRRRLQGAVARLAERGHKGSAKKHDRALGGDAAAADDLDAYLGSLDKDRVRAVARLKVAFDARAEGGEQPEDGADSGDEDARLDLAGFRARSRRSGATSTRRTSASTSTASTAGGGSSTSSTPTCLFASEDPDLRMSTGAAAAIGDRVRLLKGGHVAVGGGSSDRRLAATRAGPARRLAELKQKFDRFAVGDRVTGNEALQALTELGSTLPRRVAAAYFRDRGSNGFARDVTFFEFLRAFAALELEDGSREPKLGRSRSPSSSADSRASVDRAVARLARGAFDKPAYRRPLEPTARRTRRRERERHHRELARRRDRSDSDDSRDRRASRRRRSPSPDSPPARSRSRRAAFRAGDRVRAQYRGRSKFYPGKVGKVHADGTLDVDYDDGEREARVDPALVEKRDDDSDDGRRPRGRGLREGAKVEARYRGRSKYYKGKIARVRGDGTFDVDYDDGEKETRVLEEYIKAADSDSDDDRRRGGKLAVGDKVEARYKGRSKFYAGKIARPRGRDLRRGSSLPRPLHKGKIARDRGDGTFDIDYDDGEKETRVLEEYIKGADSDSDDDRRGGDRRGGDRLSVGDKVEALRGRSKYYPGKIARVHSDGTFDIDYDDGEKERNVDKEYVKSTGGSGGSRGRLREGAKVEARYRGRSTYDKGKISRDRGDGTFDVDYDDGEKETRVLEEYIKGMDSDSDDDRRGGSLRVATRSRRSTKAARRSTPGRSRVHSDGTYDVDYDDGEKEKRVEERLIHKLGGGSSSRGRLARRQETRVLEEYIKALGGGGSRARAARLREGAKVEARYRGRSKFYPGKISRDRGDGTFDIDYDDGEKETRVLEEYIKAVGGRDRSPSPARGSSSRRGRLREGAKVEARYRGRSKYYKGKISRDRGDGTFDIDYDDGEGDPVLEEYIKGMDSTRTTTGAAAASSTSPRGDGTFDVDYDDGEKETRVLEEYIKSTGGSSGSRGRLREGAKVEARYRGRSKYYKGRIARDRGDGTFDIDYDDGEKETRVLEEYIKGLDSDDDDRRSGGSLGEGDKVEARYRGREKYYPGKISRDRGDGTFDIAYDDGERETRVEEKLIRKLGGSSSSRGRLREGAKVEARYRGRSKYYKGKISRDRGDGTFDIDYDDGEKETRVLEEYIKGMDSDSDDDRRGGGKLDVGDKVEARYRGRSKFYPGKIARVRGDGTFDVDYDDGEKETRVLEEYIKSTGGSSGSRGRLREGAKVEARYRGRSKYDKGKIARDRGDGTFDIDYDDGEKETRVLEEYIKGMDSDSDDDRRGGARLGEGDKVEARYRGREKYHPGKISRDRGDGTFDIAYDDGERETRVEERLIRKLGGSSSRGRLREGAKVEARYRGRSKYYKGKISRDRGDGTFDIDYDDGEKETRVLEEYIKALGGGSRSRARAAAGCARAPRSRRGTAPVQVLPGKISRDRGDGTFDIDYDDGEKETRVLEEYIKAVEARYRGRSKYYKGKISRDRGDGTFDIDYDDGEKETRVLEEYIKGMDSDSDDDRRGGGKLDVGDKVEARYRGRSKYYPGKIARVRGDGTFDVDYDDGEKETRVLEEYIKSTGGSSGSRGRLREGAKVEARYRGRSKYYKGRIARDRGDGTFDIDYDDGEKETRVLEEYIKGLDSDDDDRRSGGSLGEGDKVEARYRGREKYYPGKISRDRGDGTFDIAYDDGERETRVEEKLIRKLGGSSSSRGRLREGAKVEARYRGRSKYYKGKISRDRGDGTFDIDYDDGEGDARSPSPSRGRLREGAKVEARYRGRSKFYPGKISRDRGDGTFDIDYDDGEKETRVLEEYIKAVGGRDSSPARGRLREGAKVEARYRGRSKYYKGKISRDRGDGTFDIDYDDGEKETRVLEEYIKGMDSDDDRRSGGRGRLREGAKKETRVLEEYIKGGDSDDDRGSSSRGRLREGAKVEARYRGRSKFYPGKISRDRGDGTFDVDYDDGEKETRVLEEYIKAVGGRDSSPARGRLREEPRPGDGTFDIDYDDGEKETRVLEEYIKGGDSDDDRGSSSRGRLREGAKVEARYRGRSKFYPGKISRDRDRGDGTFDVDYDDGEKETRVLEEYIKAMVSPRAGGGRGNQDGFTVGEKIEAMYKGRSVVPRPHLAGPQRRDLRHRLRRRRAGDARLGEYIRSAGGTRVGDHRGSPRSNRLQEGARVEARYRGRSKYYPGRISRDRGDGTFDIDYDDGEKETRVLEEYVKSAGGGGDDGGGGMRVGESIEARYRGRSKYYPGKIGRVHSDGTFDIDYDDGEKERGVQRHLIRSMERPSSNAMSSLD
ncbi:cytidine deaminase [Aureococcus anophagefferens]|nr:cytidine deaminase [Aureococcus anophagefferens]